MSRATSSLNVTETDNEQIRYQNILDGFQMTIEHCEHFFNEYTLAEEEALDAVFLSGHISVQNSGQRLTFFV